MIIMGYSSSASMAKMVQFGSNLAVFFFQKINAKNAFGLHLIDYMAELLKKKEMTNFQVIKFLRCCV